MMQPEGYGGSPRRKSRREGYGGSPMKDTPGIAPPREGYRDKTILREGARDRAGVEGTALFSGDGGATI